jgi:hypothetical protein
MSNATQESNAQAEQWSADEREQNEAWMQQYCPDLHH